MDGGERLLAPEGPGTWSAGRSEEAGDGHFNWPVEEDAVAGESHPQDERDPRRGGGEMPPESILSHTSQSCSNLPAEGGGQATAEMA